MKIEQEVIDWNIRFPLDRWWRNKYNVAFNSPAHRESNFLDQLFEFKEDRLFKTITSKEEYDPFSVYIMKEKESFKNEQEKLQYEAEKAKRIMLESEDEIDDY